MSLVCLNLFNCFLHQQVLVLGYNISDINFCFLLPGFFFGYEYLNSKAKPIDDGITGVLLNVIVAYVVDVFWFNRSKLHCKKLKKGLYAKETRLLHPWSLAFGSILGLVYVFGMFESVQLLFASTSLSLRL